MSSIVCSECNATVEASKAYCPDCGAAMDEELKRTSVTEFDSLMKTQNINSTTQYKMMEQFELSMIFKPPPVKADSDTNKESVAKPAQSNEKSQPNDSVSKPSSSAASQTKTGEIASTDKNQSASENASASNKNLYIAIGVISLFLILALITVIILSVLLFNYSV